MALAWGMATSSLAQDASITLDASKPGAKVSPMLWGIFFEDINCSADGGIYAEMVRNRSFEDTDKPDYWTIVSSGETKSEISIDSEKPLSARNPHSLKVKVENPGAGRYGVANGGFWGMSVKKGESYNLSLKARGGEGFTGPLTISLESADSKSYATQEIPALSGDWQECKVTLTPDSTDPKARLVISTTKAGTFWLDMVSLFPKNTWKNRPNGLRPDLAEKLVGLKPAFVRFPGGCWVEGDTMEFAYRWKKTIGDISERPTQYNIWRYHATHGLGFHEYMQMCEDLSAEPLYVINVGMSHKEVVPMDKMDEYVQDALDVIEYCNGPADSKWGSVRAKAGHPAPFNLKYMEIGNENGGPAYKERYALMVKAIKDKYPSMHLIANEWGGVPTGVPVEIVDEHYYNTPEFFMAQADRYDKYDRNGPKIYVGEYAVTQGCGLGNMRGAVGEAAFMTGMERNSDVVAMASYAPLFVNVNHRGWNPDLIGYDSYRTYGIPSYYVQKMFAENRGDVILPVQVESKETASGPQAGLVGVGTWATKAEFKDLKVESDGKTLYASDFSKGKDGWKFQGGDWKVADGALQQNSTDENIHAVIGNKDWRNYTFSLKARKISGAEGFLIIFRAQDENDRNWWNIGGWGNTGHALEIGGSSPRLPGSIETGRWYDIRVEVQDSSVKCYLDGKLIQEAQMPKRKTLFASATRDTTTGDIILKVVNTSATPLSTQLKVIGAEGDGPVSVIELSADQPTAENTLETPEKVSPKVKTLNLNESTLLYSFPGNSVTIFRGHAK
jgi:alpha-L-arabinofuranosidase